MFFQMIALWLAFSEISALPLSHIGCTHSEGIARNYDTSASESLNYVQTVYPEFLPNGLNVVKPHNTAVTTGSNYAQTNYAQITAELPPVLISAANIGVPYVRSYESLDSENDYNHEAQFSNPIISKTFYTYSGPEEHDEKTAVHHITIGKPQKNYRVIYIKSPSSSASKALIKAHVAPTEEKTVVYVLSSNENELNIESEVDEAEPTQPSKPEVVFVKYKTPEEIRHLQETVQSQYSALGGVNQVSDEGFAPVRSVVGALGDSNEDVGSHSGSVGVERAPTRETASGVSSNGDGLEPGTIGGIHYDKNLASPQYLTTTYLKELRSPAINYY